MKLTKASMVLMIVLVSISAFGGFLVGRTSKDTVLSNPGVSCTEEAKLCPDGSGVGRQGPNCEFPDCPTETPSAVEQQ
jgi:hypothetical protein